jgi:hypothetical protein
LRDHVIKGSQYLKTQLFNYPLHAITATLTVVSIFTWIIYWFVLIPNGRAKAHIDLCALKGEIMKIPQAVPVTLIVDGDLFYVCLDAPLSGDEDRLRIISAYSQNEITAWARTMGYLL